MQASLFDQARPLFAARDKTINALRCMITAAPEYFDTAHEYEKLFAHADDRNALAALYLFDSVLGELLLLYAPYNGIQQAMRQLHTISACNAALLERILAQAEHRRGAGALACTVRHALVEYIDAARQTKTPTRVRRECGAQLEACLERMHAYARQLQ